jgi:2-methylcitrate dehydratase PrpD
MQAPEWNEDRRWIDELAEYIAGASGASLPDDVMEKTKHHIFDTIGAVISGSTLKAGRLATDFAPRLGGTEEATVLVTGYRTTAVNAALANGVMAHADETDDSHAASLTHPGCAIVPAALAVAEVADATGEDLVKAIALGYDISSRMIFTLGRDESNIRGYSTHVIGGAFGATAACASLFGLDSRRVRHAISYACQLASGVTSWNRDEEHVEKAYVFAGMPASHGALAAVMVDFGFTGVDDPFSGRGNYIDTMGTVRDRAQLTSELGERFEILHANIKKWPVGSPIQAALDSMQILRAEHGLTAEDVAAIEVRLPAIEAYVVDNRPMPDISLQQMVAVMLLDGDVTFRSAQDYARMSDPETMAVRAKISLIPDEDLSVARPRRQAIVKVQTRDGRHLEHRTYAVAGTSDLPMTRDQVWTKATDLLRPVVGEAKTAKAAEQFGELDQVRSVRELIPNLVV